MSIAGIASVIVAIVLVCRGRRRTKATAIAKEVVLGFAVIGNAFGRYANKRRVLQLAGTVGVAGPGFPADSVNTCIALVAGVRTGLDISASSVALVRQCVAAAHAISDAGVFTTNPIHALAGGAL